MSKKIPSKRTYKVAYIISLVAFIFSTLLGALTITVGGVIFLLFGAFFLFLYYTYKKTWLNYDSIYKKSKKKAKKPSTTTPPKPTSDIPVVIEPIVNKPINPVLSTKPSESKEKHRVTGTSHYQKNILSLASENYDYSLSKKEIEEIYMEDDRIYELDFIIGKAELVEEPTNEYDPNAIKVVVDGVLVGYIKKGSCSHVKKLLREDKIQKLEVDIHGGKYKQLEYDYETDKYSISRGTSDFYVDLYIYRKE